MATQYRPHNVIRETRADGTVILKSGYALSEVVETSSVWLRRWAKDRPDGVFLAERSGDGWRELTYAEALQQVEAVAQSLLARGLGSDTPILIVSGNSVVHHFATIGTMAFVSGGCRCPQDVPPFMLACGSDNPEIRTINIVGMRRAGISEDTIRLVKRAHRLIYREHKRLPEVKAIFEDELQGVFPTELQTLLTAFENQAAGKQGRAREAFRNVDLRIARDDEHRAKAA